MGNESYFITAVCCHIIVELLSTGWWVLTSVISRCCTTSKNFPTVLPHNTQLPQYTWYTTTTFPHNTSTGHTHTHPCSWSSYHWGDPLLSLSPRLLPSQATRLSRAPSLTVDYTTWLTLPQDSCRAKRGCCCPPSLLRPYPVNPLNILAERSEAAHPRHYNHTRLTPRP